MVDSFVILVYKGVIGGLGRAIKGYIPVFFGLGGAIYTVQRWGGELPIWVSHYMNDFLCMPIVLFICRSVVRKLRSNDALQLPFPLILLVTLYFAIYFEYYLPRVNMRYTADIWDLVLYFIGSIFFYVMEKGRSWMDMDSSL